MRGVIIPYRGYFFIKGGIHAH